VSPFIINGLMSKSGQFHCYTRRLHQVSLQSTDLNIHVRWWLMLHRCRTSAKQSDARDRLLLKLLTSSAGFAICKSSVRGSTVELFPSNTASIRLRKFVARSFFGRAFFYRRRSRFKGLPRPWIFLRTVLSYSCARAWYANLPKAAPDQGHVRRRVYALSTRALHPKKLRDGIAEILTCITVGDVIWNLEHQSSCLACLLAQRQRTGTALGKKP
jgi:hypothetical protein